MSCFITTVKKDFTEACGPLSAVVSVKSPDWREVALKRSATVQIVLEKIHTEVKSSISNLPQRYMCRPAVKNVPVKAISRFLSSNYAAWKFNLVVVHLFLTPPFCLPPLCLTEHTGDTSPKSSSSLKCEYGDDPGEITIAVPLPTVYVNGSHVYDVQPLDPGSGKPAGSLGLGLLQKSLPLSMSLQNLSPRAKTDLPKGPVGDGRRWSFDKPDEEEKAAIAAALEQSGPMLADEEEEEEEQVRQAAPPKVASSAVESESRGKKQRRNLFSHGKSESAGKGHSQSRDESEQASAVTEEKHRGWFGSKDSHSKPR